MKNTAPARSTWRTRLGLGAAGVLVILLILLAFRSRSSAPAVDLVRVARGDLSASILCDGMLEPAPGGELRAPEAATIGLVASSEGSEVRKGDPLVRLENPTLEEALRAAQERVARLAAERTAAETHLDDARREAERQARIVASDTRLAAEGAISKAEIDADSGALARARGELTALESAVSGPGSAELALARQSVEELARRSAALTLRAPFDGVVYGLPAKPGVTVAAGDLVASVSDRRNLRVRARVDEPDLPAVRTGDRFSLTFDGIPGRSWAGAVTQVPLGLREASGRRVGEVIGEFSDPGNLLPPNASVNVSIVTGEARGALLVPRAALVSEGGGHAVFALVDGRARRREVTVGLLGTSRAEVIAGLSEGDRVILPGDASLSDGTPVSWKVSGAR